MHFAFGFLMPTYSRSGCPINLATEVVGDRWSMIVLRDIIFGERRTFRDILTNSLEGIASNILADRLRKLVENGMLTAAADPHHKQRTIYSLTEKSIALLPALVALGAWGRKFLSATPKLAVKNQVLEEGGLALQNAFMSELRTHHLGASTPDENQAISEKLRAAHAAFAAPSHKP